MRTPLVVAAVLSGLATTASAASPVMPFTLSAPHADFLAQLEEVAAAPGEVGAAGRTAVDLLAAHNAAEEAIVLPMLGHAEAIAAGATPAADPDGTLAGVATLETALPALLDLQTDVISALAELYAAADWEGQPQVASLAERIIWHETSDAEILYPAAMLVGSVADARMSTR